DHDARQNDEKVTHGQLLFGSGPTQGKPPLSISSTLAQTSNPCWREPWTAIFRRYRICTVERFP
ncbi:hypothetical protein, partial [Slackia isoflavoniconvertens]|uniref:hypothetical protein n=1 Tax=Slackia isoflavoniconvertens TaxID=572010 RepID=UPI003AF16BBE